MTLQAGSMPIDMESVTEAAVSVPARADTMLNRVVGQITARPVSRLAVGWIGLLAMLAVFAPLLANSNPWVVHVNGKWSSPLLMSLEWVDWDLLASATVVIALYFLRPIRPVIRVAIGIALVAIFSVVFKATIQTRSNVDYSVFRRLEQRGKATFWLNAPIPYSASDRLIEQAVENNQPPSRSHWMGTELNKGDVLSRLLHGCRTAMSIGFISTIIAITIGIVIGGLMGYFAGTVDLIGMRFIEVFEAIPTLVLMITLVAFFPDERYRLPMLMTIIGVTGWTGYARFLRAEILRLRTMDFVQAAVASGLSTPRIVFRHILPNGVSPVLVAASFGIAGAIVSESTLSFLHLGTIDQPSWGGLLTQSVSEGGDFHWWMAVFPGAVIFLTVLAYNRLGEAMADAIDPKQA